LAVERSRPVLKQLKTASADRVVTFGAGSAAALAGHRARQDAERRLAAEDWQDSGLVFTTQLGGWIDPSNFGRLMDSLIAKAGVPRITPKGLRHTAQSIGRVVVGDDKVMQERLGHADIGVTLNTYTHTVTKQHKQAGARIDKAFRV
jgi:integrase